jgi:anthranilate synthase component 2
MAGLLLLDNHDSFTWNLAQYLAELGADVDVRLNDEIGVDWCAARGFDAVVVSPGPGRPERAGITPQLVRAAAAWRLPLLGVCLGHQALAQAWGARIVPAPTLVHGKTSPILHDGRGLFRGLPDAFPATRYHSLVVDEATLDASFRVTARTPDGLIMGLEHRHLPLHGVQFHPESVLTLQGKRLLGNFLGLVREHHDALAGAPEGRA